MKRYFHHVSESWKALLAAATAFQVLPLFYAVVSGLSGKFEIEGFLLLMLFSFAFGAVLYLVYAAFEISRQDRVKKFFSDIDLDKVGNGSLTLIDEYTNGWGRRIIISGVHQKKKLKMHHSYSKGMWLHVLIQLEGEFFEDAASVKFDDNATPELLTKLLDEAITTSNDPKFGEIYWELKRRRGKK